MPFKEGMRTVSQQWARTVVMNRTQIHQSSHINTPRKSLSFSSNLPLTFLPKHLISRHTSSHVLQVHCPPLCRRPRLRSRSLCRSRRPMHQLLQVPRRVARTHQVCQPMVHCPWPQLNKRRTHAIHNSRKQ